MDPSAETSHVDDDNGHGGLSPASATRKRRPACERCNRRRTRCDGWLVGTPCTGCKKSNNSDVCTMVKSKRRRGADGRYVNHGGPADTDATTPVGQSSCTDSSSLSSSLAAAVPDTRPNGSATGRARTRRTVAPETATSSTQPNIVGESWYASYVMRGYKPGHVSFHRPLDDSNAMVQSISEDIQTPHDENAPAPGSSSQRQGSSSASQTQEAAPLHALPAPDLVDRLVKAYFARFHTFCPILVRPAFLNSLADGTVSGTLLRSVLFVASIHCEMETVHLLGYKDRYSANSELLGRAVAAFDSDQASDRTSMFLSSYLLHYWFGNPSAYRDSHWWLAASIRSAQCMGYHLSTRHTQMHVAEKARWKRVWWCLYIRDRQTSLSTGTPMVINDADHDVEELVPEDLPDETPETVRYLIGQLSLNRTAGRLYFLHCSPLRLPLSREASIRKNAMQDVQTTLAGWKETQGALFVPGGGGHHLALTLKVCYNYYIINLTQRLQRQAPKTETLPSSAAQIIDAATAVFALVDESLLYWSQEYFPMIYVSALFSAMVALAVDAAPPVERPDGEQLLRTIRPGLLALKQFENVYVLARWIKDFFMKCLVRWERDGQRSREGTPGNEQLSGGRPAFASDFEPGVPGLGPSELRASTNTVHTNTPGIGPAAGLDALAGFMLEQNGAQQYGDLGGGEGVYWPEYVGGDNLGFPMPESSQYQAIQFLADLGMAWTDQTGQ